jgi:ATP-dependent protease ClpP protease subunit
MKWLFAMWLAMVSAVALGKNTQETVDLQLDKDVILVRGYFNGPMAGKFIHDVSKTEKKNVVVFIKSPGGSIDSLNQMVAFMHASGKHFTCVADQAASAASALFNVCDKRLIMQNSVLMFHQASYGVQGSEGQVLSKLEMIKQMVDELEKTNADRMGMPIEKYQSLVANDLWMYGKTAFNYGAADNTANVTCSEYLLKKRVVQTFKTFFGGSIEVEFSGCPLIRHPVKIQGKEQWAVTVYKTHELNAITMGLKSFTEWIKANNDTLFKF